MGEIGRREPKPAPKRLTERQALDDDGRHREPEEGEPGQRDEETPSNTATRETAIGQRAKTPAITPGRTIRGTPGRNPDRGDVGRAEHEGANDDPVAELYAPVQERGSDGVRSRREAKREAAPEPPSVQLDRFGDDLTDRAVGGGRGSRRETSTRGRYRVPTRAPRRALPGARRGTRR